MKILIKFDTLNFIHRNVKIIIFYWLLFILVLLRSKSINHYLLYLKYDSGIDLINLIFLIFNYTFNIFIIFYVCSHHNYNLITRIKNKYIILSKIFTSFNLILFKRIIIILITFLYFNQIYNPIESIIKEISFSLFVILLIRKRWPMQLELKNISKKFKKNEVLNNISFTISSGKIIGFTGRNGSGKSVLFKIIAKILEPSDGQILTDKEKYETRVLIDGPSFLSNLTGFENLKLLANIQKKITDEEIMFYVKKLNLEKFINEKYSKYSLGTKQKLGIVQALMESPDMIILDEPFNGIEKETIPIIKELLKEEKQKNKIILLASHIENDLNDLCDEIFEVDNGNVLKIK